MMTRIFGEMVDDVDLKQPSTTYSKEARPIK